MSELIEAETDAVFFSPAADEDLITFKQAAKVMKVHSSATVHRIRGVHVDFPMIMSGTGNAHSPLKISKTHLLDWMKLHPTGWYTGMNSLTRAPTEPISPFNHMALMFLLGKNQLAALGRYRVSHLELDKLQDDYV
jgi:hypothetical protein